MTTSNETISLVAARVASVLAGWAGLDPVSKADNGDRSERSGLALVLGSMVKSQVPAATSDALAKLAPYLEQTMRTRQTDRGSVYLTYGVDCLADRDLAELSSACGLSAEVWPIKSHLNVQIDSDGSASVSDRRGYGSRGVQHYLLGQPRGWLTVEGYHVPRELHELVREAAVARRLPSARWEPLAADGSTG